MAVAGAGTCRAHTTVHVVSTTASLPATPATAELQVAGPTAAPGHAEPGADFEPDCLVRQAQRGLCWRAQQRSARTPATVHVEASPLRGSRTAGPGRSMGGANGPGERSLHLGDWATLGRVPPGRIPQLGRTIGAGVLREGQGGKYMRRRSGSGRIVGSRVEPPRDDVAHLVVNEGPRPEICRPLTTSPAPTQAQPPPGRGRTALASPA